MDYRNNRHRGIDLHTHSTASDGTLAPQEIVVLAGQSNLAAISITDHDTLEGVRQISSASLPGNLLFIPGIELSTSWPPAVSISGSMHLLGYGFRVNDPDLNNVLHQLKISRDNRTPGIIDRLNELGFSITYDDVHRHGSGGQVGRPHIALCMVEKGYATDIDDAFNRFLGNGKPAYVDRYRISAEEGIVLIRSAGGVPVLAHPVLYGWPDFATLRACVGSLKQMGIMGIEAYYPGHSPEETKWLIALARKLALLVTGGTDFHGDLKPDIALGVGNGDLMVPFSLYKSLMAVIA